MEKAQQTMSTKVIEEVAVGLTHVHPKYGGDISEMSKLMTDVVGNLELTMHDPTGEEASKVYNMVAEVKLM